MPAACFCSRPLKSQVCRGLGQPIIITALCATPYALIQSRQRRRCRTEPHSSDEHLTESQTMVGDSMRPGRQYSQHGARVHMNGQREPWRGSAASVWGYVWPWKSPATAAPPICCRLCTVPFWHAGGLAGHDYGFELQKSLRLTMAFVTWRMAFIAWRFEWLSPLHGDDRGCVTSLM